MRGNWSSSITWIITYLLFNSTQKQIVNLSNHENVVTNTITVYTLSTSIILVTVPSPIGLYVLFVIWRKTKCYASTNSKSFYFLHNYVHEQSADLTSEQYFLNRLMNVQSNLIGTRSCPFNQSYPMFQHSISHPWLSPSISACRGITMTW